LTALFEEESGLSKLVLPYCSSDLGSDIEVTNGEILLHILWPEHEHQDFP